MSAVTRLTERIERWTGIALNRGGVSYALERYLERRVPELGFATPGDYVDSVTEDAPELRSLIGVITVPHSWFFRDAEQWQIIEGLIERVSRREPIVRIWVPGCASGEDAYTVAMIAACRGIKVEILASDINPGILATARRGVYGVWSVREVPDAYRHFFHRRRTEELELDESIRRMVSFAPHNLVHPPLAPSAGHWDIVVCRNVFIYLSRSHVASALQRLGHALRLGGWLVLGASDLVYSLPPDLVADYERGRLVFRRAENALHVAAGVRVVAPPRPQPVVPIVLRPLAHASAPPIVASTEGSREVNVSMLVTQANQHLDAGRHARALSLYEDAQRLDPLAPEPYFFAGVAHHKEGQLEHAVHRLRSSLFLQPSLWPASLYLALCYERMQRTEEASHEYRRVVEAGDAPLRFRSESSLCHDLEHWRSEVVTLARRRARRKTP
jgi:chemotaxis protein methyltransferase CheR